MKKTALIVDDSPLIHNLLRRALEKCNYEVCGDARNGKEGVELFKKLAPDVVFMDINMPVMDGLEAVKDIKDFLGKTGGGSRIIMLSAVGDDEIVAKAQELGVKTFIRKPFNDYKIISALSMVE
jgi:two-component system chemotaxis response regulator CheY